MNSKEIELSIGIDKLKFGMTPEMATEILGEANEKNNVSYSDEDPEYISEEWHYDTIEMSIVFDMLDKMELTTISVSSEQYTLEGKQLIGLEREKVMNLIGEMDINPDWEELVEDDPNSATITNEEEGLSLYFEDGLLSEIQWEML